MSVIQPELLTADFLNRLARNLQATGLDDEVLTLHVRAFHLVKGSAIKNDTLC